MTEGFFDSLKHNYLIEQKLPKDFASKVKLALKLAEVQSRFLEKLGYKKLAPVSDLCDVWLYQKDGCFCVLGREKRRTRLKDDRLSGDILLCLNDKGYNYCLPSGEEGSHYYKVKDGIYYFLWANDEYIELKYLDTSQLNNCNDEFEYIKDEKFVAIKYYEKNKCADGLMSEAERLNERPHKDLIISRTKDICHIEVFVFFYKDKIVVENEDEVIVYDSDFNIIYNNDCSFEIWETNSTTYLIFPYDATVLDLMDLKQIKLESDGLQEWYFAKTFKNILICYDEEHFPVQHIQSDIYYDDYSDWDDNYESEETPVRNTYGHVFDSSFKLLREFNVIGKISKLKEFGDDIAMIVESSSIEDNDTNAYYKVNVPNVTQHNDKTGEDFSIPDITFRDMADFNSKQLVIVKTKVLSSETIYFTDRYNIESVEANYFTIKSGVCSCVDKDKGIYRKIIECKYDSIVPLPIVDDENIYYVGVIGLEKDNMCDLYINHMLVLKNIPFNNGDSVSLVEDGSFIQVINSDGNIGIIRNGGFIIEPNYKWIKTFVWRDKKIDSDTNITLETLKYLFMVTDGELYGVCSQNGTLILPMKYSKIDMDDKSNIVLVRDYNEKSDDKQNAEIKEMLEYGSIYEIGHYDEKQDIVTIKKATFKDGVVLLCNEGDYIWDGRFRYLNENDFSEWTEEDSWDALTDGMYGDMPRDPRLYDMMMDAMGF